MLDVADLHRYTRRLGVQDREQVIEGIPLTPKATQPVLRSNGSPVSTAVFDHLMTDLRARIDDEAWIEDRPSSDRWLAPRLHYSLRLTRSEAADRGMWLWVALRHAWYVQWRWATAADIAEDRWFGPIHKQAFARLWWGGELFRDGSDYSSVERAFRLQDFPNSYLHRPVARCRSLALGLVDVATRASSDAPAPTARQVNNLARVLNLTTASSPPEADVGYQADDVLGYLAWVHRNPVLPETWDDMPGGPQTNDTTEPSRRAGAEIAHRGMAYARMAMSQISQGPS